MANTEFKLCLFSPTAEYSDVEKQEEILEYIRQAFGEGEYERLMGISNMRRRAESVGALVCLSRLCEPSRIERSELGKPYFADKESDLFSLSHSGEISAAVYGLCEVGLDIEVYKPSSHYKMIAKRCFTKEQLERFEKSGEAYEEFLRIWTEKEACAKYLGVGVTRLPKEVPISLRYKHYEVMFAQKNYHVCVCAKGDFSVLSEASTEEIKIKET